MSSEIQSSRSVVMEKMFAHPQQKVWRALTEKALVAQWLMKNDFEPEVGRRFQLRSEPMPNWDGIIDCEVLVVEPLKELSYRWSTFGLDTVVNFTLTPTEGGTLVHMEHSGFPMDRDANYKGAMYGWQKFLGAMDKVVGELGAE
ncbi:Uncharacterized conserved protein YndB, AHSA1/START domain [Bryocella elongata]|uniref:Uncharacterized conserved protein YndB, AHSA1/START domain n=1 Tax=Bryocella elongata TaxID=863522 RepID=A0A1H6A4D6_9BACT|nr:SRPBCC domain-containing protein [Bryocella elongata]SEG43222.1 Uncharacterized conserved protein YndB, AHSA1/START domain [Bryocella elongata]